MKKLILITLATLMLTACQPTPEQNIVVEKDTERMVEQAMPEDTQQAIPTISELVPDDRYVYEETGANGKLTLTMDAEIIVPDVDYMPITEVSMAIFTQEQVTALFNHVFPGEKPIADVGIVETKPMFEQDIINLKKQLAETQDATQKQEISNRIAELENIYAELPEEQPEGGVSDGTMIDYDLSVFTDDASLNVSTSPTEEIMGLPSRMSYRLGDSRYYAIQEYSGEIPQEMQDSFPYTYGEAEQMCYEYLALLGYDESEFYPKSVQIMQEGDLEGNIGEAYAIDFSFSRQVNSVPTFINMIGEPPFGDYPDETFAAIWQYETLLFQVDNEGVVRLTWDAPIDIGENITDEALLLSFEETKNIFENMMMTTYEGFAGTVLSGEYDVGVNTKSAELLLLRVREQGEESKGLYVPVWVFSGSVSMKNDTGDTRYFGSSYSYARFVNSAEMNSQPIEGDTRSEFERFTVVEEEIFPLLVVNAVDGSIIDLNKGY